MCCAVLHAVSAAAAVLVGTMLVAPASDTRPSSDAFSGLRPLPARADGGPAGVWLEAQYRVLLRSSPPLLDDALADRCFKDSGPKLDTADALMLWHRLHQKKQKKTTE